MDDKQIPNGEDNEKIPSSESEEVLQQNEVEENEVKFGSIIALFSAEANGYVGAEGFADMHLNALNAEFLQETSVCSQDLGLYNFNERLFTTIPAQQYAAAAALEKYFVDNPKRNNDSSLIDYKPTITEMRLIESEKLERRLNEENKRKSSGSCIRYGQIIQLMHVQSSKFLTVSPRLLSETEKNAMLIDLKKEGTQEAHFMILPKYKHVTAGDKILIGDEVYVMSVSWHVKLHIGLELQSYGGKEIQLKEVNGSTFASYFKICLYSDSSLIQTKKIKQKACIKGGEIIRLFHYHIEGFISASVEKSSRNVNYSKRQLFTHSPPAPDLEQVFLQHNRSDSDSSAMANSGVSGPSATVHSSPNVDNGSSINCLWQIQNINITDGRAVSVNENYCLRHLTIRKYLCMVKDRTSGAYSLSLTHSRDRNCHFFLRPTSSTIHLTQVEDGFSVYLQHSVSGRWLHCSGAFSDLERQRLIGSGSRNLDQSDAIQLQYVRPYESNEALFLLSLLPRIKEIGTDIPKFHALSIREIKQQSKVAERVLSELIVFLLDTENGPSVSANLTKNLELLKIKNFTAWKVNKDRQNALQELHTIETLAINILQLPFREWGGPFNASRFREMNELDIFSQEYVAIRSVATMCKLAYRLIFFIVKSNNAKCVSCAKFMAIFLNHVGLGVDAEELITELLSSCPEIASDVIEEEILAVVERQISKSPKHTKFFLRFLSMLCCVKGKGIPVQQERLAEVLFPPSLDFEQFTKKQENKVLDSFNILVNLAVLDSSPWIEIYEPFVAVEGEDVDIVSFEEDRGDWITLSAVNRQHPRLCEYLIALIDLFASLCASRNYICIYHVQRIFSRDLILNIMNEQNLSYGIKAAFCHLLIHLYIDRQPHEVRIVPQTIHLFSQCKDPEYGNREKTWVIHAERALKDSNDLDFFSQIKDLIRLTLKSCLGKLKLIEQNKNHFVLHILRLAHKVMQFGYYCHKEEIIGITKLVLPLLDDRPKDKKNSNPTGMFEELASVIPTSVLRATSPDFKLGKNLSRIHPLLGKKSENGVITPPPQESDQDQPKRRRGSNMLSFEKEVEITQLRRKSVDSIEIFRTEEDEDDQEGIDLNSPSLRYQRNALNEDIMGCKLVVCCILKHFFLVSIEEHVCKVLAAFASDLNKNFPKCIAYLSTQSKTDEHLNMKGAATGLQRLSLRRQMTIKSNGASEKRTASKVSGVSVISKQSERLTSAIGDHKKMLMSKLSPALNFSPKNALTSRNESNATENESLEIEGIGRLWTSYAEKLQSIKAPHITDLTSVTMLDEKETGINITGILIDLLMYDHPELVSAAMNLLGRYFDRHNEFVSKTTRIELILTSDLESTYESLKESAALLRLYEETSETWMCAQSEPTWRIVVELLLSLAELMEPNGNDTVENCALNSYSLHYQAKNGTKSTSDHQRDVECSNTQSLVRALGIHQIVMDLLRSSIHALSTTVRHSSNRIFLRKIENVVDHCGIFLQSFAHNNSTNQQILANDIELFKRCVFSQHLHFDIIRSIYQSNLELCANVSEEFLEFIVRLIEKFGPSSGLLDILQNFSVCNGTPIKENQNVISQLLMMPHREKHVLELYNTETSNIEKLLDIFKSSKDVDNEVGDIILPKVYTLPKRVAIFGKTKSIEKFDEQKLKQSKQQQNGIEVAMMWMDTLKEKSSSGRAESFRSVESGELVLEKDEAMDLDNEDYLSSVGEKIESLLRSEASRKMWLASITKIPKLTKEKQKLKSRKDPSHSEEDEVEDTGPNKDKILSIQMNWMTKAQKGTVLYPAQPIAYYARLLNLLAVLTYGENFVCEARLQGLLPLDGLVETLRDPRIHIAIKSKLVYVLHEGWISTEQIVPEIGRHTGIMEMIIEMAIYISSLAHSISSAKWESVEKVFDMFGHDFMYIFDSVMPMLRKYIAFHCDALQLHPTQIRAVVHFAKAMDKLSHCFDDGSIQWYQILSLVEVEEANGVLEDIENLTTSQMRKEAFLIFHEIPKSVVEERMVVDQNVVLRSISKCFARFLGWLSQANHFQQLTKANKRKMLEEFIDLGRHAVSEVSDAEHEDGQEGGVLDNTGYSRNSTTTSNLVKLGKENLKKGKGNLSKLGVSKLGETFNLSTQSSVRANLQDIIYEGRFGFLMDRLIRHADASEIRHGIMVSDATMEVLNVLTNIAAFSSLTRKQIAHLAGAEMFLHLFCRAHEDDDRVQSILLLFGTTILRDGNKFVQKKLFDMLSTGKYNTFFDRLNRRINDAINELELKAGSIDLIELPEDGLIISIFELIRLLCEGQYTEMQNLLRKQTSTNSRNLVSKTVEYFDTVLKVLSPQTVPILKQTLETIIEMAQGPCEENQITIVDPQECNGCSFVEMASSLLALRNEESGYDPEVIRDLKFCCTLALCSLLEGRKDSIIHERMASLLPMRLLKETMIAVHSDYMELHEGKYTEDAFLGNILSPEGKQREHFLARMIRISIGQGHLPVNANEDEDVESSGRKQSAILNIGFNIYMLLQRLLEVPSIGSVLHSTVVPSKEQLSKVHSDRTRKSIARESTYAEAYAFFHSHCASVEIVRNEVLQRFYFPKPPVCEFLTSDMKEKLNLEVNRESPTRKIHDLFVRTDDLISEMTHRYIMSFPGDVLFTRGKDISFFIAIIINLIIISCYVSDSDPAYHTAMDESNVLTLHSIDGMETKCIGTLLGVPRGTWITILGLLQSLTSSFVVVIFVFTYGPLIMLKKWKHYDRQLLLNLQKQSLEEETGNGAKSNNTTNTNSSAYPMGSTQQEQSQDEEFVPKKKIKFISMIKEDEKHPIFTFYGIPIYKRSLERVIRSIVFLFSSPIYLYYYAYLFMTLCGNFIHNFFFAFHLFDVLLRYPELTIVLHAVVAPYKSLILTFLLFLVFEYFFAIFGFTFLRSHYHAYADEFIGTSKEDMYQCNNLFTCFLTTFDAGFKSDGGIGGYLVPVDPDDSFMWSMRLIFDNFFFIIMITILMNIIFGIIIDTFADQRGIMQAREDDMMNKCFVCDFDRGVFDRMTHYGYQKHITEDHHLWNYIFLVAHLRFKAKTDYDGVEQYLWDCIKKEDWVFMPLYKSMIFESCEEGDVSLQAIKAQQN